MSATDGAVIETKSDGKTDEDGEFLSPAISPRLTRSLSRRSSKMFDSAFQKLSPVGELDSTRLTESIAWLYEAVDILQANICRVDERQRRTEVRNIGSVEPPSCDAVVDLQADGSPSELQPIKEDNDLLGSVVGRPSSRCASDGATTNCSDFGSSHVSRAVTPSGMGSRASSVTPRTLLILTSDSSLAAEDQGLRELEKRWRNEDKQNVQRQAVEDRLLSMQLESMQSDIESRPKVKDLHELRCFVTERLDVSRRKLFEDVDLLGSALRDELACDRKRLLLQLESMQSTMVPSSSSFLETRERNMSSASLGLVPRDVSLDHDSHELESALVQVEMDFKELRERMKLMESRDLDPTSESRTLCDDLGRGLRTFRSVVVKEMQDIQGRLADLEEVSMIQRRDSLGVDTINDDILNKVPDRKSSVVIASGPAHFARTRGGEGSAVAPGADPGTTNQSHLEPQELKSFLSGESTEIDSFGNEGPSGQGVCFIQRLKRLEENTKELVVIRQEQLRLAGVLAQFGKLDFDGLSCLRAETKDLSVRMHRELREIQVVVGCIEACVPRETRKAVQLFKRAAVPSPGCIADSAASSVTREQMEAEARLHKLREEIEKQLSGGISMISREYENVLQVVKGIERAHISLRSEVDDIKTGKRKGDSVINGAASSSAIGQGDIVQTSSGDCPGQTDLDLKNWKPSGIQSLERSHWGSAQPRSDLEAVSTAEISAKVDNTEPTTAVELRNDSFGSWFGDRVSGSSIPSRPQTAASIVHLSLGKSTAAPTRAGGASTAHRTPLRKSSTNFDRTDASRSQSHGRLPSLGR